MEIQFNMNYLLPPFVAKSPAGDIGVGYILFESAPLNLILLSSASLRTELIRLSQNRDRRKSRLFVVADSNGSIGDGE